MRIRSKTTRSKLSTDLETEYRRLKDPGSDKTRRLETRRLGALMTAIELVLALQDVIIVAHLTTLLVTVLTSPASENVFLAAPPDTLLVSALATRPLDVRKVQLVLVLKLVVRTSNRTTRRPETAQWSLSGFLRTAEGSCPRLLVLEIPETRCTEKRIPSETRAPNSYPVVEPVNPSNSPTLSPRKETRSEN